MRFERPLTNSQLMLPVVVFTGCLAVYGLTISLGAFPGESAKLVAEHGGFMPLMSTANPLWSLCVWALARLPLGGLVWRLNVFSALCAAAAVWMLRRLVSRVVRLAIEPNTTDEGTADTAAELAGLTAGLFLAFSVPFWITANRAHPAPLDLLLLFWAAYLLVGLALRWSLGRALGCVFLYGVGIIEFPTFTIFLPLFIGFFIFILWQAGQLRKTVVARLALAGAAGLLFSFVPAIRMFLSEAYALKGYTSFPQVLYFMVRDHWNLILGSLPKLYWLLVLMVTAVPWLIVLALGRRGLNSEKDWGLLALHVVMMAVSLSVLFNAPFSPWRLLGLGRLLVTPYALAASCFGYLTAYWFLWPATWWREAEEGWRVPVRRHAGRILAGAAVAAAIWAGVRNMPEADARPAGAINRYARALAEACRDREWLVTDGSLEENLLIAAREAGLPLRLMNIRLDQNPVYGRYISRQLDNSRLQALSQAGLIPLLSEWLRTDSNATDRLALFSMPDLWLSAGFTPLPDRLVFLGMAPETSVSVDEIWRRHEMLWKDSVFEELKLLRDGKHMLSFLARHLLRHASMVANNLGVFLEDRGEEALAFKAYQQARRLEPDNISALMNQQAMLDGGYESEEADQIRSDFDRLVRQAKGRYEAWSLSRYFGYVRSPEAFARLGMAWALSGYPALASSGIRRLAEMDPAEGEKADRFLASAYLSQDRPEESEALYRRALERNPGDSEALLGLTRALAAQGRFDEAVAHLDRAVEAGCDSRRALLERAGISFLRGDPASGRAQLEALAKQDDRPEVLAALVEILARQGDLKAAERYEEKLRELKEPNVVAIAARAFAALARGDRQAARHLYEQALALRPNHIRLLEILLRMDLEDGRTDKAVERVRRLLAIDSGHAFGNYTLGWLQLRRGEYAFAETSLRKSLERRRSFEALNDLAWVLQERGALEEGERLAREALAMREDSHAPWDTLGVILLKQGRSEEAEAALNRASALAPWDLNVQVHMALLYERMGRREEALDLCAVLLDKGAEMALESRQELHRLRQRLMADR